MPYNITLTNGTELITGGLLDNTSDSANSSLTLVGKNFKSYGLFLNQNFVRLMENFAFGTAPVAPLPGQLWFNSTTKRINLNVSSTKGALNAIWRPLVVMSYSGSQPTNPSQGEQWYNSTTGQLYVYTGTEWRLIGPISQLTYGNSGAIPDIITNVIPAGTYVVVKILIEGTLVGIWSKDGPLETDIPGFGTILKGLNLNTSTTDQRFAGISSVAESVLINGSIVFANAFLRSDTTGSINGALTLNSDGGLTLGLANDFVASVSGGVVTLRNQTNNRDLILSLKSGGLQTNFLRGNSTTGLAEAYAHPISSSPGLTYATKNYVDILGGSVNGTANFFGHVTPSSNVTLTLGNTTNRWNNIFSQSILVGNVNAANISTTRGNISSIFLGADLIPTSNIFSNVGSNGMRFNTLHSVAASLTGSLSVGGNASVAYDATIGQNLDIYGSITVFTTTNLANVNVTGNLISTSSTSSSSTETGALVVPGGAGVGGALFVGGNIVANAVTASTSTTTGALVVRGGIGVAGTIISGGNLVAASGTASVNNTTGALVVTGGIGISGSIYNGGVIVSGGNIVALSGIASTTTSTGALVVLGGVGISGAINTGSNVNVGSNLIATGASITGNITVGNRIFAGIGNFSGNVTAANISSGITSATELSVGTSALIGGNITINGNSIVGTNQAITGNLAVASTATSTSTSSGAVTVAGGIGVAGNLHVGGTIVTATMPSGTSNTAVATTAFVFQNSVPTGALVMWPTASAPTGFLLCNGTAVSRTTYSALFSVIGTTFGVGDNSTTFNLPNYINRMPVGAGGSFAANATGGSANAIVVSHTHTATGTFVTGVTRTFVDVDGAVESTSANVVNNVSTTTGTANISTSGSSGTNANMPPYLAIYFIIKT